MPNRRTDALFQLIHSLQKSEKRNFKLYVTRNSGNEDLKIVQLFDALDKMTEYDEALILKKNGAIKKQQLSNIKAHLYKQILASLRLLESEENIDIQLHEQLDYARILYNKGLYLQSLKILEKIKELAAANNQISFLVQVLFLEKKIETLHITRSMQDRAAQLATETRTTNERLVKITELSNLALQLYSWYIKNGHARNERDEAEVALFFNAQLQPQLREVTTFYEKLYLYQCYTWYAFIRHDFLMYYRYTQKWVDLFTAEPLMIDIETAHYIKGVHNLLNAHFYLKNHKKFIQVLHNLEAFNEKISNTKNENNKIQTFIYLHTAKINLYFTEGNFTEGLSLIPQIEEQLKAYELYLDKHRILVFYYKIASLYFGAGDYEQTIAYLNKIINWKTDLRTDLQCYARLLNLIAHYELGNLSLVEYLIKSVYRYLASMENMSRVEQKIFKFLRSTFHLSKKEIRQAFEQLLEDLLELEKNKFEARAFTYLDFISWLQSKVSGIPVQDIIRQKFLSGVAQPH